MHNVIRILMFLALASPLAANDFDVTGSQGTRLGITVMSDFESPWAMTFLPDASLLVTEKGARLWHVVQDGAKTEVQGLWDVAYASREDGLGDVVLHPEFESNSWVYISYVEDAADDPSRSGAVVARAKLDLARRPLELTSFERIWEQVPKVGGRYHYSYRIAFGPGGKLFITSGGRRIFSEAQSFDSNLGKVIRLNDDGTVPADNPWRDQGEIARSFWSIGHRNMLGLAFDRQDQLWVHEMGPRHGDELNLILPGNNYGWPHVSEGNHYSGEPIPDHETRPEFDPPRLHWVPSIAPSGLAIYDGDLFADWNGDAIIGGLVSQSLIRVQLGGVIPEELERFGWGRRIREVEQGPEGAIYVLEDRAGGRLLKLVPDR